MPQPISSDSSDRDCSLASATVALVVVVLSLTAAAVPLLPAAIGTMAARVVSALP
jgi:hypothetical protein